MTELTIPTTSLGSQEEASQYSAFCLVYHTDAKTSLVDKRRISRGYRNRSRPWLLGVRSLCLTSVQNPRQGRGGSACLVTTGISEHGTQVLCHCSVVQMQKNQPGPSHSAVSVRVSSYPELTGVCINNRLHV